MRPTPLRSRLGNRKTRSRRSQGFVTLSVASTVLAGTLAAAFGLPNHSRLLNLLSGHGWVASNSSGDVLLANGSSGVVDLEVSIPGQHHNFQIVVSGTQAEVYDNAAGAGRLSSVNLSNATSGHSVKIGEGLDLVPTSTILYVVNEKNGLVDALNPQTNQLLSYYQFAGVISDGVATAGSSGLWVVQQSTGTLAELHLQSGRLSVEDQVPVVSPRDDVELCTQNNGVGILDLSSPRYVSVNGTSVSSVVQLHVPPGATPTLPVSAEGSEVPIAMSGSDVLDLVEGNSVRIVTLPLPHSESFGPPVTFGGRIYLPVPQQGAVLVLSTSGQPVSPAIAVGGTDVQAYVQSGYLWVNNPDGSKAFSVSDDGVLKAINKNPTSVPGKHTSSHPTSVTKTSVTQTTKPGATSKPGSGRTGTPNPPTPKPPLHPKPPSAPSNVLATASNASIELTWGFAQPNGSPVAFYEWAYAQSSTWYRAEGIDSTPITSLQNGTYYRFQVRAVDQAHQSGVAALSNRAQPTSATPDAPSNVMVAPEPKQGALEVSWQAPPNTGDTISRYWVYAIPSGGQAIILQNWIVGTQTIVGTLQGLILGTKYSFAVRAEDSQDVTSALSQRSRKILLASLPGSPILAPTPEPTGTGAITEKWSCPLSCTGGEPVTGWTVVASEQSPSPPIYVPSSSVESLGSGNYAVDVTNLPNLGPWEIAIQVSTKLGSGPPATSVYIDAAQLPEIGITPDITNDSAPPFANTQPTVEPQDAGPAVSATVTVTANGTPITGCTVDFPNGVNADCFSGENGGSSSLLSGGNLALWNSSYTITATVTVAKRYAAPSQASQGLTVLGKPLTVDAGPWFPPCGHTEYCGANAHSFPTPIFPSGGLNSSNSTPQGANTAVAALCYWVSTGTGGTVHGEAGGDPSTNIWVQLSGQSMPWMAILWFANVNDGGTLDTNSALPQCTAG